MTKDSTEFKKTNSNWAWRWAEPESELAVSKKTKDSGDMMSKSTTSLRYSFFSAFRQMLLRTEAARRQFEPRYRKKVDYSKYSKEGYLISSFSFLKSFFSIFLVFSTFIVFIIFISKDILLPFNSILQDFSSPFRMIYESINHLLHFIVETVIDFLKWLDSIYLTENSERIVIPNPFIKNLSN